MTSDHQARANRRNAQQSTGPQTPEGRARSSANAIRHGAFSTRPTLAATVSVLNEDPVEIDLLMRNLIEELDPMTPLQTALAQSAAEGVLAQRRARQIVTTLLNAAELTVTERNEIGDGAYEVDFGHRLLAAIDAAEGLTDEQQHWAQIVHDLWLKSTPGVSFRLGQIWPDGEDRGPSSDEEWRAKFAELVGLVFGGFAEAREFAEEHVDFHHPAAEAEARELAGIEAKRVLKELERLSTLHERVDRGLARTLATYRAIREMDADEEPPPWI